MAVQDIYSLLSSQGFNHHWKFDEASGTLADSISSLDMTASNVTFNSDALIASKPNAGSLLASSSGRAVTGASFSGNATNLVIHFFVKGNPLDTVLRNIFEIQDVCVLRMSNRYLRLGITSSESPTYTSGDGGWEEFEMMDNFNHQVIVRIVGTSLEMIVDGQWYQTTMSASLSSSFTNKIVGALYSGFYMSSLAVKLGTITDAQVTALLRAGRGMDASANLIASNGGTVTADGTTEEVLLTFTDGDVTVGTDAIAETAHTLETGQKVQLTTTGTLPAGLSLATTYYVIDNSANDFKLASTLANALTGTAVDITAASGGGTHTVSSLDDPLEINEAFRLSYMIGMGNDLELLAGEYAKTSLITCRLMGKSGSIIRVVPHSGIGAEDVIFEKKNLSASTRILSLQGQYYDFYSPYLKNADGLYRTVTSASDGLLFTAKNSRLINPIIRDQTNNGIFKQGEATNSGLYDALLFNNGRWHSSPVNPTGHNMYCQHYSSTDRFTIKNYVTWGAADFGVQIWGQTSDLKGVDVENYIGLPTGDWDNEGSYSSGLLIQSYRIISDITVANAILWRVNANLGRSGDPHTDWTVSGLNLYEGSVDIAQIANLTITGLHWINGSVNDWTDGNATPPEDFANLSISGSKYDGAGLSASSNLWNIDGGGNQTLSQWQSASSTDSDAVIRDTTSNPYSSAFIAYFPSDFITGNCFVNIYNPLDSASVNIDLSETGLVDGQTYTIRDVQNYDTVLDSGTYDEASPTLAITTTGSTIQTPIGYTIDGTAANRIDRRNKTLKIIGGAVNASAPSQPISAVGTRDNNTDMTFGWSLQGAVTTSVEFRFRAVGATTWTTRVLSAGAESRQETGLSTGTQYEWQVRGVNASGSSEWTAAETDTLTGLNYFGATAPLLES